MKLIADYVWTYIIGHYPEEIIEPITSYAMEGRWFSQKYKKGYWDGRVRYVKYDRSKKLRYFPTGFLTRITKALDEASYKYELEDKREYAYYEPNYQLAGGIDLSQGKYNYQGGALDVCLSRGCGIVRLPTGGGKTELGAAILNSIGGKGLWLTHRLNLAYQTKERFERRLNRAVGLVGDSQWDLQDITIAMVQSVKPELLDIDWDVVIGDEIHHLESKQWFEVFSKIKAPYRFGLSATPHLVNDGLSLLAMTGDVIYDIPVQDLIEREVLVKPNIWFANVNEPKIKKGASYQEAYSLGIVHNAARNDIIKRMCIILAQEHKPTLVLVKRLNHGELLTEILNHANVSTEFIRGSSGASERANAIERLRDGRIMAIVATTEIFGEGADIPALRAVVNATGSKGGGNAAEGDSGRGTIQILGRGLRSMVGKPEFDYFDFADKQHRFLADASYDRVNTLESEGYTDFIKPWHEYGLQSS